MLSPWRRHQSFSAYFWLSNNACLCHWISWVPNTHIAAMVSWRWVTGVGFDCLTFCLFLLHAIVLIENWKLLAIVSANNSTVYAHKNYLLLTFDDWGIFRMRKIILNCVNLMAYSNNRFCFRPGISRLLKYSGAGTCYYRVFWVLTYQHLMNHKLTACRTSDCSWKDADVSHRFRGKIKVTLSWVPAVIYF